MKTAVLGVMLWPALALSAEQPRDFAYGVPIQIDGREALYEVDIPAAVYRGVTRIKPSARRRVPYLVRVKPDGQLVADGQPGGEDAWFLPSPFRFCIGCGITYASGREFEFSRLAGLSSGGRSTDTLSG